MVLCLTCTSGASADLWVLRAGLARERPITTDPEGYGNHGRYDGTNGGELDRADRRHANWDRAPGLVVELARERAAAWRGPGFLPLTLALEPFARLTLVDTEFNQTQHDWRYLTLVAGPRVTLSFSRVPWVALHGGVAAGAGSVAREAAGLWEAEYGLEVGPFRVTGARQFLEGGRQVEQLYFTQEFELGGPSHEEPFTADWAMGVFTRFTRHPSRRVKGIHQTGVQLTRYFGPGEHACRLAFEAEASIAPVESEVRRPLNENVEHNYRTQDEVFWAFYFGQDRCLSALPGYSLNVRAGIEAFYEDDPRVNGGRETGWFVGGKLKAGLWRRHNTLVSYGVVGVLGVDPFGTDYGVELAIATRL